MPSPPWLALLLAAAASAAPLPLAGGGLLCHPRPAGADSLPRLPALDSLLVNGHLPAGSTLRVGGAPARVLADGRFADQVLFPADRLLRLDWTEPDGTERERLVPLLVPAGRAADPPAWTVPLDVELGPNAVLSTAPGAAYWLFPPAGLRARALETRGRWLRLELSPELSAWTSVDRLAGWSSAAGGAVTAANAPEPRRVGPRTTLLEGEDGDLALLFPVSGEGPPLWRSEVEPEAGRLRLTLSGAVSAIDWTPLPADGRLRLVDWEPLPGQELALRFDFEPGRFRGHRVGWADGRLRVDFFARPPRLKGARVLLDPGHGGADTGCVGASGTTEAELNLALAVELARQLRRAGATVALTREDDRSLGLYERVALADSLDADVVLSIHHDSVGEREDPWSASGGSVFFWSPWAAEAARILHRETVERLDFEDRGLHWRSLALLRQEARPALLVEAGTLVHPADEDRLLDEHQRRRQARALLKALDAWFDR